MKILVASEMSVRIESKFTCSMGVARPGGGCFRIPCARYDACYVKQTR